MNDAQKVLGAGPRLVVSACVHSRASQRASKKNMLFALPPPRVTAGGTLAAVASAAAGVVRRLSGGHDVGSALGVVVGLAAST